MAVSSFTARSLGSTAAAGTVMGMPPVSELPLIASGKVRDMYDMGDRLLMVASDRIPTYDAVHPTPIPDKGKVPPARSVFWFELTGEIVPHHRLPATDGVPAEARG